MIYVDLCLVTLLKICILKEVLFPSKFRTAEHVWGGGWNNTVFGAQYIFMYSKLLLKIFACLGQFYNLLNNTIQWYLFHAMVFIP